MTTDKYMEILSCVADARQMQKEARLGEHILHFLRSRNLLPSKNPFSKDSLKKLLETLTRREKGSIGAIVAEAKQPATETEAVVVDVPEQEKVATVVLDAAMVRKVAAIRGYCTER